MAKLTQLDKAIAAVNAKIDNLQAVKAELLALRDARPARKPRPVKPVAGTSAA